MRSRRSVLVLLLSAAVLSACGGGGNDGNGAEPALAPTTTVGQTSLLTSVPTTAPASLALPTTLAPTTLTPATVAATAIPTTTRQAVTLPPGVTEADRIAAEAAAIGWWEEFFRQIDALPEFDPQAILRLTVPGRPAGPKMLSELEKDQTRRFSFEPGTIQQTVLTETRFLTADRVEIKVCLADDGAFVQQDTGAKELGGLGRSFYLTVLQRTFGEWKIENWGSYQSSEDGRPCV